MQDCGKGQERSGNIAQPNSRVEGCLENKAGFDGHTVGYASKPAILSPERTLVRELALNPAPMPPKLVVAARAGKMEQNPAKTEFRQTHWQYILMGSCARWSFGNCGCVHMLFTLFNRKNGRTLQFSETELACLRAMLWRTPRRMPQE